MTILDEIVAYKKAKMPARQRLMPEERLRQMAQGQSRALDFTAALRGENIRLIAEVKKASPSAGLIQPDFNPVETARTYVAGGAAAISVLTETRYFLGSLKHLRDIKKALGDKRVPLLRKDFIFDPYQVYEARAYGADALLLIVAILTPDKLRELLVFSHELGMACLVETHNEAEVATALKSGVRVIGINNRDLRTFKTDLSTTERLRPMIPQDKVVVTESGIKNAADVARLRRCGVDAMLIGEALMTSNDVPARIREFLRA